MKKLLLTFSILLASLAYSQVPQAFSYQTIAFNSTGSPIVNGAVNLKISILDNSATGTVLYTETQSKTTNSKGLVNLNIGQGTPVTGSFSGINWGANSKFIKVEMDPAGGSNYTNVGVNQLLSVPYANVSKTVVTGAGQGITLVSPNGTNYNLNVNDSGTLNLPTSTSSSSTIPANMYMYGAYNSYNASSAELLRIDLNNIKQGYKYFSANTQIKFIASQSSGAQVYGNNGSNVLVANGTAINISSNGLYHIYLSNYGTGSQDYNIVVTNINPIIPYLGSSITSSATTYNASTQKYSINLSGVTSSIGSIGLLISKRYGLFQSQLFFDLKKAFSNV
jgi:hypothetical protein